MSEDSREALKSMIQNLAKDNIEMAQLDLHPVITSKMVEMAGTKTSKQRVIEPDENEE